VRFGASGQIGTELAHVYAGVVHAMPWEERGDWLPRIRALSPRPLNVVFANGLTDPSLTPAALKAANLDFPARIIAAVRELPGARFLTLGTIQENFPELCRSNAYLDSKLALGGMIREVATQPGMQARVMHIRLHTVYGGAAKPHMFLGQMMNALQAGRTFEMSSGDQLREYHHVADIAASLNAILQAEWEGIGPVLEITSGAPVRLADLAQAVFKAVGRESALKIGTLARPPAENTQKVFPRSPEWLLPRSRPALEGVAEYVRTSLKG
jgi:nucleoside-diphosphate-sugar epimerase